MVGCIVKNGYYTSPAYERQIAAFQKEFTAAGVPVRVIENHRAVDTETRFDADFCVFLDKDVPLARLMEEKGVRVFNPAESIRIADDKGLTAACLAGKVKQQRTVFRPKRYVYGGPDEAFLRDVEKVLGYPMVAKFSHGSLGEQVSLVRSFDELREADGKMGTEDGVYQAFRAGSVGKSYRVIVVGDEAIGAMELTNDRDFRSNAHEGGAGRAVDLPPRFYETARTAAKLLGLSYCGVDLFCDDDVVIEVNSNAFFEEFGEKTGINVAQRYVNFIIGECI